MYVDHDVVIDILRPQKKVIHVVQDDSTRRIKLTLLMGDVPFIMSEHLPSAESITGLVAFRKPDGHSGLYDTTSTNIQAVQPVASGPDAGYVFTVYLDGQVFTAPGNTIINVQFMTNSGKLLHTFQITADVELSATSETEPSNDFYRIESIADIRIALEDIKTAYNGIVYQTPGDAVRAQAFTGTDTTLAISGKAADAKATGDSLNVLKSAVYKTTDRTNEYTAKSYIAYVDVGNVVSTTPITNNSFSHIIISCKKGDTFNVSGIGGSAPRLWGFTDAEYMAVSWAPISDAMRSEVVTAPVDGFFISNVQTSGGVTHSLVAHQVINLAEVPEDIADAKNEIDNINNSIIIDASFNVNVWESGTISAASGGNANATTVIRTKSYIDIDGGIFRFYTDNDHEFNLYGWNGNTYLGFWNGTSFQKTGSALTHFSKNRDVKPLLIAGATKIRITFRKTNTTDITATEGSNLKYFGNIPLLVSAQVEQIKATLNTADSPYNHGPFCTSETDFSAYYSGLQEDYSAFGQSTKYEDVIEAFDGLVSEFPDYISKTSLGTASGLDAGGNSYTMYEYVFAPKRKTSPYYDKKNPKIYMDGSIHGFEKNSTYGLYYFLKDICENFHKNESLLSLRSFVEFHIIPVSNPYGFDNDSYLNGNSVNINRNFDHPGDWTVNPAGSDYNGLAAFDQPESAIMRDWIIAGESDILMYFNCHTNGRVTTGYDEMNPCMTSNDRNDAYYNKLIGVFAKHIDQQTAILPRMYQAITPSTSEMCGTITTSATASSTKGTASAWASTIRTMLAMTLETFNGLKDNDDNTVISAFSDLSKKINSEIIGNIVIQMLKEYSGY